MPENDFTTRVEKILAHIADSIENQDSEGIVDVELSNDILNLTTPLGTYVINKHSAMQQIWLASPLSGPHHFSFDGKNWNNKDGQELFVLINEELNRSISLKL